VVVPIASVTGQRRISFHIVQTGKLAKGNALRGCDPVVGCSHLHDSSLERFGVAVSHGKDLTIEVMGRSNERLQPWKSGPLGPRKSHPIFEASAPAGSLDEQRKHSWLITSQSLV
jgi:hypothetical protein